MTERSDWDNDKVKTHVRRQRSLMQRLRRLPLFSIVLSHGATLGWGCEYLLTADYILATPTASFALPETGLGILPGARGSAELASLIGSAQALRLGATGEKIDAKEALRIGLIQEVYANVDEGLERVTAFAKLLQKRSPTSIAAYKHAVLESLGREEDERLEIEASAYELCVDSGEAAIGRKSFAAIRAGETPTWGKRQKLEAKTRN